MDNDSSFLDATGPQQREGLVGKISSTPFGPLQPAPGFSEWTVYAKPLPESVCQEAQRLTHNDRRESYGHPLDDYERTAALINVAFRDKLCATLTPEDVMLCMILVKISRQRNTPKRDNLVDVAGYANCIDMAVNERERRRANDPTRT